MSYAWHGGREYWWRLGPAHAPQVLWIEPLFEEKNRCRRLIASIMRLLDQRGIGSILPDLPGTGESLTEISAVAFADWQAAIHAAAAAAHPVNAMIVASIRGGALLDGDVPAAGHWRLAPESGARIVRDLRRAQRASDQDEALYAGHRLTDAFVATLEAATPAQPKRLRTVRLASDASDADHKIEGSPLWRRAEPGDDPALASAIADDIGDWVTSCVTS